jgi:hypothetical protein
MTGHLECVVSIPGTTILQSPKILPGRALDGRSWGKDPTAAALMAHDLVTGAVVLFRLTQSQALALTGATQRYVWVVNELTATERAGVEAGYLSLSALAQGRRKTLNLDMAS